MLAKTLRIGIPCRPMVALILALCLISISQAPAVALSVDDYFTISYDVAFSKSVVYDNEVFYATVTVQAACTNDLPLPVSEAIITGSIVAEHEESGTRVVLNASYTVSISPFPNKAGEASQVSRSVALQFPAGSEPGGYNVAGELIEARVKAILWFTVTAYLPPSQEMGPVTYRIDSGGGGGGGGGGSTAKPIPPGTTSTEGRINGQGIVLETIVAPSEDYRCSITLYEGTQALDENGQPLKEISIVEVREPPVPPAGRTIVGFAYNIGPNGTVFEPPALLALVYDESQVPPGVNEEDLVIATRDETMGEWVELEGSLVDPLANIITVPVGHLTAFTVMAYTAPPAFTISGLSISAAETGVGQGVAITVVVANSSNLAGSYEVILKINGEVEERREITLAGGASEAVTFNVTRDAADVYVVDVNGQLGSFVVWEEAFLAFTVSGLSISAAETGVGQGVAIT
ncbi:MAG: hypothetical protein V3W01_03100, partial [Dehalococcoidales bacterium]